ncbi:MAG: hypothetical protein JNL98_17690 [Bryobacterales bacterium]|nr:hypothetical protein [Bryobacterales bacterium]
MPTLSDRQQIRSALQTLVEQRSALNSAIAALEELAQIRARAPKLLQMPEPPEQRAKQILLLSRGIVA